MAEVTKTPDGNSLFPLPCGCKMGTDEATMAFVFLPHAEDCEYYLYTLAESERQGKPIVTIGEW